MQLVLTYPAVKMGLNLSIFFLSLEQHFSNSGKAY